MSSRMQKLRSLFEDRLVFFAVLICAGCIFTLVYLVLTGNADQVYTDIVVGDLAAYGSNKSSERSLFYILSLVGSAFYFLYFMWSKQAGRLSASSPDRPVAVSDTTAVSIALFVLLATSCLFYNEVHSLLAACFLCFLLLLVVDKALVPLSITFVCVCLYAVIAVYRLYIHLGGALRSLPRTDSSADMAAFTATLSRSFLPIRYVLAPILLLTVCLCCLKIRKTCFVRGILAGQCFVPLLLLVYLAADYTYQGQYIRLDPPPRACLLIYLLIAVCTGEAFLHAYRYWRSCEDWRDIISLGTCICVLAFNCFDGSGAVFTGDMHHPFENIITYSQVFRQGQKLFSEFYPPSGLYAILNGFFFDFWGGGLIENYNLTSNLFYLFIVLLLVALLSLHVKRAYLFALALLFCIPDYNRIVFILPIILLLSCPQLLRRKNLWLQAWFLTSYLHGLYYPVYGAAVALGFFPLGIWQLSQLIKSGELRLQIRRIGFWLGWFVCILPALLGIPLLLGLLRHTLALSSQTIYADGLSRYGQDVWPAFLPNIEHVSLRLIFYCLFSFMILPAAVWICVALGLRLGKVKLFRRHLQMAQPVPFLLTLAGAIALLISFSFSTVQLGFSDMLSRSRGMLFAVSVLLLLVAGRYLPKGRSWCVLLGACVFFFAASQDVGFFNVDRGSRLRASYMAPDGYVYTDGDPVVKWGRAFVSPDSYDTVKACYEKAQTLDRERTYLQFSSWFGYNYLCDIKGAAAIEDLTVCGYRPAQETAATLAANHSIVGKISSFTHYYLYHWLLTSGDYVWDPVSEYFWPNEDDLSRQEVLERNKAADYVPVHTDMHLEMSSWGSSIDTLRDIMTEVDVPFTASAQTDCLQIDFDAPLDGDIADFLYLDLAQMDTDYSYVLLPQFNPQEKDPLANLFMKKNYNPDTQVTVEWQGSEGEPYGLTGMAGKGKLLIPLGSGKDWLLHSHDRLTVYLSRYGQKIPMPDVVSLQFLKVRALDPKL